MTQHAQDVSGLARHDWQWSGSDVTKERKSMYPLYNNECVMVINHRLRLLSVYNPDSHRVMNSRESILNGTEVI